MSLIDELTASIGLGRSDLAVIISTAPARYKEYDIAKRSGGVRRIAQPSRELKAIQRFILENKLSSYPVHKAATGYVKGANIYENASLHVGKPKILKLDFVDFFPSFTTQDWEILNRRRKVSVSRFDMLVYNQVLFWGKKTKSPICLSIGAPTSPMLSNILMYDLDVKIQAVALRNKVTYTRYADDMTFSGDTYEVLIKVESSVRSLIERTTSPKLRLNDKKRGLFGKGQRRYVTGLVLTPEEKISLGRDRKRLISSMIHKCKLKQLDFKDVLRLKGLLGFSLANEPTFVESMRRKYGNDVIDFVIAQPSKIG